MNRAASQSALLRVAIAMMMVGIGLHAAHALFDLGGGALDGFIDNGVYTGIELIAVAICAARVIAVREDRVAWALMTFGLLAWTAGDLVWTLWLDNVSSPPDPSVADALYLAMYPAMYVSWMLLIRSRLRHVGKAQWLDGATVGLAIAAIAAGIVLPAVLRMNTGHLMEDIVNLAYPLGDFTLLAFVVVAFSLSGWRPGRMWLLLGLGMALSATADIIYVYQAADGTYTAGGILNTMWPAAMALLAVAAWQPPRMRAAAPVPAPHTIVVTAISACLALGLLVYAACDHVTPLAVALAAAALLVSWLRATLTYLQNVRMLRRNADDVLTDGLSGLGNRRRLMEDLETVIRHADDAHPSTLAFFDLNGFKRYNDTFGHAAGDSLLARLGAGLRRAVMSVGSAYRLGGDEFCVLLRGSFNRQDAVIARAAAALIEKGAAFTVSASVGVALVPDEAASASAALQLADQRMYAEKARRTQTVHSGTRDALMQLLNERTPDLHEHVDGVGQLVLTLGREFGLDAEQLDELLRAAELHDVGKLAVPDDILHKPGPLNSAEWHFMRQHTLVGERILNVDPALRPISRLVRASHERWDGQGYPDGLAGAQIPLGARIIAACDAFEAMTSDRVYQHARGDAEAIAELRRHAGSQFDPEVIDALCRLLSGDATSPTARVAGPAAA
jgi:two-component system, cell cycle response regulator